MEMGLYPYYGPDGVRYLPTSGEDYSISGTQSGKRGKLRKNALWVEAGRLPGNRGREDLDALVSFIEGDHGGAKHEDAVSKASKARRTKETSTGAKSPTASSASSDSGDGGSLQHHSTLTSNRESGDSWQSTGSTKPPQIVSVSSSCLTSDADEAEDTEAFRQPSPAPIVPVNNSTATTVAAAPESRFRDETIESDENDAADEEDELFTPVRPKTSRRAKQWLQPPSVSSTRRSPTSRFPDSQRRGDAPRYAKQASYPADAAYTKLAVAPSRPVRPTPLHSVSGSSINASAPATPGNAAANVQPNAKPAWNVVATQRSTTAVRPPQPALRAAAPPASNRWAASGKPTAVVAPGQGLPVAAENKVSNDDNTAEKSPCDDMHLRDVRSFVESAFCALLEHQQADESRVLHYHVGLCWKPVARTHDVEGAPGRTSTVHTLEHDVVKTAA